MTRMTIDTTAGLGTAGAVIAAGVAAAVLAAVHLFAPHLRSLPGVPERALGSFAGGLAVAYVFLHLLPEVAEGNERVAEALEDVVTSTPMSELAIFAVALTGFTLMYGLERRAEHAGSPRSRVSTGDSSGESSADDPPPGVFYLHLASFTLYNGVIAYTLPLHFRTGVLFAILFTVAIGLHILLTDRGMSEHYPGRFAAGGRYVLAAALIVGWAASALFAPTSTLVVSLLTALVGGAVLLNVFKEELPGAGSRSSFAWFLAGLVLYAVLLAAVTALH